MTHEDAMEMIKNFCNVPKILLVHTNDYEQQIVSSSNNKIPSVKSGTFFLCYTKIKPNIFDKLFKVTRYHLTEVQYLDRTDPETVKSTTLFNAVGDYSKNQTPVTIGSEQPNTTVSNVPHKTEYKRMTPLNYFL